MTPPIMNQSRFVNMFSASVCRDFESKKVLNYCNVGSWKDYQSFISSGQSQFYTENTINRYFKDFEYTLIGEEEEDENK